MSNKLVTLGTYWNTEEAYLARLRLDEAGIKFTLADENIVSNAWHLANTVGGIKLMVLDTDVDRAIQVLEKYEAETEQNNEPPLADEEYLKDGDEEAKDFFSIPVQEEGPPNAREILAERAFRSTLFGFLFQPLLLYAVILLVKVFFRNETLRPKYFRKSIFVAVITLPIITLFFTVIYWLISR